jgi:hypothetical protein
MSFLAGGNLLKGGFIYFDAPGSAPKILAFQYNPETLNRGLEPVFLPVSAPGQPASPPREVIQFKLALDATDKLETGDPVAAELGIFPQLSALELLMQASASSPNSLTVFVWSKNRILPVRITGLQIAEQLFDNRLNPIRAEIAVALLVLNSADLSADPHAQELWQAHLALMRQLAQMAGQPTLSQLGLTEIP